MEDVTLQQPVGLHEIIRQINSTLILKEYLLSVRSTPITDDLYNLIATLNVIHLVEFQVHLFNYERLLHVQNSLLCAFRAVLVSDGAIE